MRFHSKIYQQINTQLKHDFKNIQHTIMEMIFSDSSILRTNPQITVRLTLTTNEHITKQNITITVKMLPKMSSVGSSAYKCGIALQMQREDVNVYSICHRASGIKW